ncbi:hypothetical protein [Clostridium autoethanogenum]|uniref:Uncharacterized protein n=1 Tax=Clostridium autoethanogenum DSM 10061 TaxID=1341692 RepID=A0ABN4BKH5_9CLOT|nr:hypothetical protein [Clostridium autoethanogenum]AGY78147.1 hypothetical protein CAETHG_3946 [Clostridium autoethanogenum DSM 10061]ALU38280.1 Hypothetical protein CLAU_3853 [Clostridium autoethanogenum DSM 10061]OVY51043.1 hypothetical protein WX72_02205 [Clostridium autoethanogenum]
MVVLQKYLGAKVNIYIYASVESYNNEQEDTSLKGVTVTEVTDDFIEIEDERGLSHCINLKKCFSVVVERERSLGY